MQAARAAFRDVLCKIMVRVNSRFLLDPDVRAIIVYVKQWCVLNHGGNCWFL